MSPHSGHHYHSAMEVNLMRGSRWAAPALIGMTLVACGKGSGSSATADSTKTAAANAPAKGCDADNGGLKLPAGFCASVFADSLGHVRHLVVAPNGVVYVNTWSGRYYDDATPP
jgi:glucose/arabinose dehydrogenase